MNEKIDIKPKFLSPFKRFCMTIGELPTSYVETMTYYEMILWFTKYLGDTVIPAINNNAEALREVQSLFIELQDYVNSYFDDLNIQTEIDNKLDAMAESGQLVEIISAYLDSQAIISFDTLSDMVEAENLTSGSVVRTLGKNTLNDGLGNLYKVRTKEVSDVSDSDYLVDLDVSNTLIAQKIFNKSNKKYLLIGDSYATGYQGENVTPIEGFFTKVVNDLSLNAQIVAANGYGFLGMSGNHKWLTLIQNTTINNKESFTDIIIAGGMNDVATHQEIITAMNELITYLKTNFINATIHIGMIGKYKFASNENLSRIIHLGLVYKATAIKNNCKYIDGGELILHNTNYIIADDIHPSTQGQLQLAYGIEQYIINNKITSFMDISTYNTSMQSSIVPAENTTNNFSMYSWIENEKTYLTLAGVITFTGNKTISNNDDIVFGKLNNSYICGSPNLQGINQFVRFSAYAVETINGSHFVSIGGKLYNDSYGNIHFKVFSVEDNGGVIDELEITELAIYYQALKFEVDSYRC